MDLPKDNDKLDTLWLHAAGPTIDQCVVDDFRGKELKVTMLTGSFPNLSWAGHKKVFYEKDGITYGHNVTFRFIKWGRFFLHVRVNEIDGKDVLIINYHVFANGTITRKIVDHVRWLEEYQVYLGRFNYGDPPEFVGYFTLSE